MAEKEINERMPAFFIGHGSPLNIILKNAFTKSLVHLGKGKPRPKAIMVVSAHWLTRGTCVTCMEKPRTICDFHGFPEELYEMEYPCSGSPSYAKAAAELIETTRVRCDYEWGLDHASWSVLKHMYPRADIPVFEMSLDFSRDGRNSRSLPRHYEIASRLAPLRERGVLVIGSGNIVHNLGKMDFSDIDSEPFEWARTFDEKVKQNLIKRNHGGLIDYRSMGESAALAVPTLDHYLPMIYVIALQREEENVTFTHEGFQYGSVSMRCFRIG